MYSYGVNLYHHFGISANFSFMFAYDSPCVATKPTLDNQALSVPQRHHQLPLYVHYPRAYRIFQSR